MSEQTIVQYCAPVLAGLKTANLFSWHFADQKAMRREVLALRRQVERKGLRLRVLAFRSGRSLLYLYRPQALARDLSQEDAAALLAQCGYQIDTVESLLAELYSRISAAKEFPHEIGLFLGYPPADVKGFMDHHAAHYKCAGTWKVYSDEAGAALKFRQYRHCTEVYRRRAAEGYPLEKLTVAEPVLSNR